MELFWGQRLWNIEQSEKSEGREKSHTSSNTGDCSGPIPSILNSYIYS